MTGVWISGALFVVAMFGGFMYHLGVRDTLRDFDDALNRARSRWEQQDRTHG